jgi:hypothetical protein
MVTPDAGTPDSGTPMPTMLTASGSLTGTISAPAPVVGYDATGNVSSFYIAQMADGPFKAEVTMGFMGRPTAMTYSNTTTGFTCDVTLTSGTAATDTWVASTTAPAQGTCSLTVTGMPTVGSQGYIVHGSITLSTVSHGGAASGMVMLAGTF